MGCGANSKITVVEPVKPSGEHDFLEVQRAGGGDRGDSAVSKHTTDSGLGLETAEGVLPGAVPRPLPPLRVNSLAQNSVPSPRQESSEILEQLLSQGILSAQPHKASSGEAYSIMMDNAEKPLRRPPPRLEKLMVRKEQGTATRTQEDIQEKMRQAEERRQIKEDELKVRLRTKSARRRPAAQMEDEDCTVVDELQLGPLGVQHSPHTSPDHQNHISSLESRLEIGQEGGDERERERGGWTIGDKDGCRRDAVLIESLNMESDSTFQQIEDIEEIF